jgi:hypothetical protein
MQQTKSEMVGVTATPSIRILEDNIKTEIQDVEFEGVDSNHVTLDTVLWRLLRMR